MPKIAINLSMLSIHLEFFHTVGCNILNMTSLENSSNLFSFISCWKIFKSFKSMQQKKFNRKKLEISKIFFAEYLKYFLKSNQSKKNYPFIDKIFFYRKNLSTQVNINLYRYLVQLRSFPLKLVLQTAIHYLLFTLSIEDKIFFKNNLIIILQLSTSHYKLILFITKYSQFT